MKRTNRIFLFYIGMPLLGLIAVACGREFVFDSERQELQNAQESQLSLLSPLTESNATTPPSTTQNSSTNIEIEQLTYPSDAPLAAPPQGLDAFENRVLYGGSIPHVCHPRYSSLNILLTSKYCRPYLRGINSYYGRDRYHPYRNPGYRIKRDVGRVGGYYDDDDDDRGRRRRRH